MTAQLKITCWNQKHMVRRGIIIGLTLILILAVFRVLLWLKRPQAEWDISPDILVVQVAFHGFEVSVDYIPDVQIWGDGRIIWVEYDEKGNRQVLEGHLSQKDMEKVIVEFIDLGVFDFHLSLNPTLTEISIMVNLLDARKTMRKNELAEAERDLIDFLKSGAGARGTEFIPTIGDLGVYARQDTQFRDQAPKYQWPTDKFGYGLKEIDTLHSRWKRISGDELAFAWKIANDSVPLVESEGQVYLLAVLVPGITY